MNSCTVEGCSRPVLARGICAPHYSTWHRQQRKYTIECAHCGQTARVQRSKAKYCSRTCAAHAQLEGATAAQVIAQAKRRADRLLPIPYTGPPFQRKPKRPPQPIPGRKGRYFCGTCKACGNTYVSPMPGATCSPQCQTAHLNSMRRIGKDRRRAREREAYVEDVHRKKIFERDRYRCHICKRKTDPTKPAPHPRSPTLDHIVPLAEGGKHEPANCRTACFLCNCTRGDRGGGEQLALLA